MATNLPTHADPLDPSIGLVSAVATELHGPLLDELGCLYVGTSDVTARQVPIWPAGYALDQGAVTAPSGQRVALVGQEVTLDGGWYPTDDYEAMQSYVIGDVPSWCRQGPYWFVSGVAQ